MAFFSGSVTVTASVVVFAIAVNSVFYFCIAQAFCIAGTDIDGIVGVFIPLGIAADIGLQCCIKHARIN